MSLEEQNKRIIYLLEEILEILEAVTSRWRDENKILKGDVKISGEITVEGGDITVHDPR